VTHEPQVHPSAVIEVDELVLGRGAVIEAGVVLRGRRVVLGDYVYVGEGFKSLAPELHAGDYTKLHARTFANGDHPIQIGRNCWIGGDCVLDSIGGLTLADGVGVGAHSQLWSHMRFGDVVEGCRFNSAKPLVIGADAWFVGHCIVSPVTVGERAMALAGSVVTRDLAPNRVYAGVPASDVTEKTGPQFAERTAAEKASHLRALIAAFEAERPELAGQLCVVEEAGAVGDDARTYFDTSTRTYTKKHGAAEVAFLQAHVPLVKFVPRD